MSVRTVIDQAGLVWTAVVSTECGGYDGSSFVRFTRDGFHRPVFGKIDAGTFSRLSEEEIGNVLSLAIELYLSIDAITAPPRVRMSRPGEVRQTSASDGRGQHE